MNSERHSRPTATGPARSRRTAALPSVYLRFRLRLVRFAIARLERRLDDEFATEDMAPMLEELKALHAEQAALLQRIEGTR